MYLQSKLRKNEAVAFETSLRTCTFIELYNTNKESTLFMINAKCVSMINAECVFMINAKCVANLRLRFAVASVM